MQTKLAEKVDHSLCLRASLALVTAHRSSHQVRLNNWAGWTCKVVSGMFKLGGQWWMEWRAKVIVQNDGSA